MNLPTSQDAGMVGCTPKEVIGTLKRDAARDNGDACPRGGGCSDTCNPLRQPLDAQSSWFFPSHLPQPPHLNDLTRVLEDSADPDADAGPKLHPLPIKARAQEEGSRAPAVARCAAKGERQLVGSAPAAENGAGESNEMQGWWARFFSRIRGRVRSERRGGSRERAAKTRASTSPPRSSTTTLAQSALSRTTSLDLPSEDDDTLSPRRPGILSRLRSAASLGSTDHGRGPPASALSTPLPRRRDISRSGSVDNGRGPPTSSVSTPLPRRRNFSRSSSMDDGRGPATSTASTPLPSRRCISRSSSIERALSSPSSPSSTPSPHRHFLSLARATSSESRIGLYRAAIEAEVTASPWTFLPEPPIRLARQRCGSKGKKKTFSLNPLNPILY
ncbi:hypothetical protein BDK51DRAFT_39841 [Blyttiomyces helicus]|uniref:Uncharacterized protein n=1 Tax=Blyttiomyces helicus TaxID=388810 RepID=A0A4P9W038_9FUNG|nr:hypothetical protein BDK51DRAFT_39841 [Blyttiomyces helicus]|eukprot:RKO85469.1 hypothetical protein BDK51DRAFT_39841 [Blyttiomyces helicus]